MKLSIRLGPRRSAVRRIKLGACDEAELQQVESNRGSQEDGSRRCRPHRAVVLFSGLWSESPENGNSPSGVWKHFGISGAKVRQTPPGDVPSDAKAHNSRALLAFEEEILQIADCLAGDAVEIEPVSAKLLQKMEFSPFLGATRISLILNFAFSRIPKTPRPVSALPDGGFMSAYRA